MSCPEGFLWRVDVSYLPKVLIVRWEEVWESSVGMEVEEEKEGQIFIC